MYASTPATGGAAARASENGPPVAPEGPLPFGPTPALPAWQQMMFLGVWAAVSFGGCYFARTLDAAFGGWPFGYWWAAQGALGGFTLLLACHAALSNRAERKAAERGTPASAPSTVARTVPDTRD